MEVVPIAALFLLVWSGVYSLPPTIQINSTSENIAAPIVNCPLLCSCSRVRSGLIKVQCTNKIVSISDIDLDPISAQVVHLNLSNNLIEDIGVRPFIKLSKLKKLDLSANRISFLKRLSFEGLHDLDVLKLSQNSFTKIDKGTFDDLSALRKLDLSRNSVRCDCSQLWLIEWARNLSSIKLPECSSPPRLQGLAMSKLDHEQISQCASQLIVSDVLDLYPDQDQVVFEGDQLALQCRATNVLIETSDPNNPSVTWFWGNQDPSKTFQEVRIENHYDKENGLLQSILAIDHLVQNHSGQWNCLLVSGQANHSRTISVIVISENTRYCPLFVTKTNKGVYTWPRTVVGFTAELPCEMPGYGSDGEMRARQECDSKGDWQFLNVSSCSYTSETTRILQDFSRMNLTEDHGPAILESAQRLHNLSIGPPPISDKMDVVFLSKAINNYLKFLPKEKHLAPLLLDMISASMHLPRSLMYSAQIEDQSCSKLVHSVETVAQHIPSLQSHKSNLAVEEFTVNHDNFQGITCFWYKMAPNEETNRNESQVSRLFHCALRNSSAFTSNKENIIEASIQIPASLFLQLKLQGLPVQSTHQLLVSMFGNGHLFPRTINNDTNDRWDVASCVIGTKLVGMRVRNLTETDPLYVAVRPSAMRGAGGWVQPVWWDEDMNGGVGGWSQQGCYSSHFTMGLLFFRCDRFGYFGLLQELPYLRENKPLNSSNLKLSHPAIYVGSATLIIGLLIAIVTYIAGSPSIQMPKRSKHALVNTWIAISMLCFIFSVGVHQTDDIVLCQSVGLILHYFSLSTLLWMAITVSNLRKRVKKRHPLELGSDDDLPPSSPPPPKPLVGLYMVGWGVGSMVVGVSGAVNLKQWSYIVRDEYCFLAPSPALGAVLVPCVAVIMYLLVCVLLVRCDIAQRHGDTNVQLSDGTQGTENVDLELLDCAAPVPPDMASVSVVSAASSEVEDAEHSLGTQLRAALIVLLLFLSMWAAGAMSTAYQLHFFLPHSETIFSSAYAVIAILMTVFILFFHCFARSDVRSFWQSLRCRKRSISDTHALQRPLPRSDPKANDVSVLEKVPNTERNLVTPAPVSVSNRMSSSTSINSNKSQNLKAAVELNKSVEDGNVDMTCQSKVSNLHLMPITNYRSYQSVTDPEVFYNARQSDMARKFFKKQRRQRQAAFQHNHLGARRRGDGGGDHSDLEHTIRDSLRSSRSKVSNTNIHVEHQDDGIIINPVHNRNILTEETLLPDSMERWVIGADSPPQINNDGTRKENVSDRINSPVQSQSGYLHNPGTLESASSRRSRSSGSRSVDRSHSRRRREKIRNNIASNGTVSSLSSVRSRDWRENNRRRPINAINFPPYEEASAHCFETNSALSEASVPVSRVSEVDSELRPVHRSSRSSKSPRSRRRHKRAISSNLPTHPTSLASSALSLPSKDVHAKMGNGVRNPSDNADMGSDDDQEGSCISKKETCV